MSDLHSQNIISFKWINMCPWRVQECGKDKYMKVTLKSRLKNKTTPMVKYYITLHIIMNSSKRNLVDTFVEYIKTEKKSSWIQCSIAVNSNEKSQIHTFCVIRHQSVRVKVMVNWHRGRGRGWQEVHTVIFFLWGFCNIFTIFINNWSVLCCTLVQQTALRVNCSQTGNTMALVQTEMLLSHKAIN